jgi:Hormone receptor domain
MQGKIIKLTYVDSIDSSNAYRVLFCFPSGPFDDDDNDANGLQCPPVWDDITCWNATPAGHLAIQPCPDYYHNFLLDGQKYND